jgi:ubiquinone/menaquinone biosynthesis C-methylase UbiE
MIKISDPGNDQICDEFDVIAAELPLQNATVLELGCGKAEKTRRIATSGKVASIVAMEVDAIQHGKNLQIADLPNVTFYRGAAEAIPADDASFDIVMMFKSLHHVPTDMMEPVFGEIRRVLKPGGLAWISEPVYAGAFNEVIRLFHDEKEVREAAFAATQRAVSEGRFQLVRQRFFSVASHFRDFDQFEEQVIRVTHMNHHLHPELHQALARFGDAYPGVVVDALTGHEVEQLLAFFTCHLFGRKARRQLNQFFPVHLEQTLGSEISVEENRIGSGVMR